MAYLDISAPTPPRVSPNLFVGVASPLWSYFAAANAGGLAFWWMTRWTRPVNLEALFDRSMKALKPSPALAPVVAPLVEPVAEAVEAVIETLAAPAPEPESLPVVGGEAAPMSPLAAEAVAAPEPLVEAPMAFVTPELAIEAGPEPIVEVAPEPVVEAVAEPMIEPAPEPVATETVAEAAPAPKPKAKKAVPPPALDA